MHAITLALFAAATATAGSDSAIQVVKTFPALSGPNPPSAPTSSADLTGAVGTKYLVAFPNAGFAVYSKEDGHLVQPAQTQMEFWTTALTNAGGTLVADGKPYDPRMSYDPLSRRWFAAANVNVKGMSSTMLIAVSQDDDPMHPWKAVAYSMPGAIDNVKLGLDRNGFYTTALAGRAGPEAIQVPVVAIPKADLLWKGAALPSLAHANVFEVPGGGRMSDRKYGGVEGMVPAMDFDPKKKPGDPEIYVNRVRKEVDGETILQIRKLTWTSPTKATLSEPIEIGLGTHYTVQPTTLGVQPPLPGGLISPGIRAGEARIVNAVVKHGSLWTVAAAEVGERTGAFWVEVDLEAMKLVQHGTLGDPDGDIVFPSINVDAHRNVGIGMSHTSAREAPSIYVTGHLAGDAPGTLRPLVRAVEGKYVHLRKDVDLTKPGQSVSWSDHSIVVMDPSDPSLFWTYQEATTNETMPPETNGDRFGTHWVAWRVGGGKGAK